MTIDQGMNIGEVRQLADDLARAADALSRHAAALDRLVAGSRWVGATGARFKNDWWPQHRRALLQTSADLNGYSQSARNNAAEQQTASQATGAGATAGGWVSPGASQREIDWHDLAGRSIFYGGKIVDLEAFIRDFKHIRQLKGFTDLFKKATPVKLGAMGAIGAGWDIYHLFDRVSKGSVDGSIRSGIDVGFDIGGLAFPQVGLAKGAWDVGWQVGKGIDWVIGDKLGGHQAFIDSVVIDRYGGSLSGSEAEDLAHRYDGPKGFGYYLGDNVRNASNAAKSLWKGVFG